MNELLLQLIKAAVRQKRHFMKRSYHGEREVGIEAWNDLEDWVWEGTDV